MIVALVDDLLNRAAMQGWEGMALPTLPDGAVADLSADTDLIGLLPEAAGDAAVYYLQEGIWRQMMTLPETVANAAVERLLALARVAKGSAEPPEGEIRCETAGGEHVLLTLRYEPLAGRVVMIK